MAGWEKKSPTVASKKGTSSLDFNWADEFKVAEDLKPINGLKFGIYARAKYGKSTFGLGWPKPIIAIDTEAALRTNSRSYPREDRLQMFIKEVVNCNDDGEFNLTTALRSMGSAINILTKIIMISELPEDKLTDDDKKLLEQLPFDPRGAKGTILIDSASDMWEWLKLWLETEAATKFTKDGSMMRTEWGKPNKEYTRFMKLLLRTHWNVVFTYRAFKRITDKGADLDIYDPSWQKKTDYDLDLYGELDHDGVHRILKFRGGRLPGMDDMPDLIDPSWDNLVEHIKKYSGIDLNDC